MLSCGEEKVLVQIHKVLLSICAQQTVNKIAFLLS